MPPVCLLVLVYRKLQKRLWTREEHLVVSKWSIVSFQCNAERVLALRLTVIMGFYCFEHVMSQIWTAVLNKMAIRLFCNWKRTRSLKAISRFLYWADFISAKGGWGRTSWAKRWRLLNMLLLLSGSGSLPVVTSPVMRNVSNLDTRVST